MVGPDMPEEIESDAHQGLTRDIIKPWKIKL